MLDLLGITALRPGVSQSGKGDHPVNWDESKANPWPGLPNPLLLANGKPVKTAKVWWTQRRPQLVELFDREILGRVPANVPAVRWEVVSTTPGTEAGIATITKHLVGHVDNSAYPAITVNIEADLILPADAASRSRRSSSTHARPSRQQRRPARPLAKTADSRQRMGLRSVLSHQLPGRQRSRSRAGHYRPHQPRPAAQA